MGLNWKKKELNTRRKWGLLGDGMDRWCMRTLRLREMRQLSRMGLETWPDVDPIPEGCPGGVPWP